VMDKERPIDKKYIKYDIYKLCSAKTALKGAKEAVVGDGGDRIKLLGRGMKGNAVYALAYVAAAMCEHFDVIKETAQAMIEHDLRAEAYTLHGEAGEAFTEASMVVFSEKLEDGDEDDDEDDSHPF